jgi:hypothetical protein
LPVRILISFSPEEDGKITYYNRYVDDIFLILVYNRTKTTPQNILERFNTLHKDLQFTLNEETNNQIAYLDLELTNKNGTSRNENIQKTHNYRHYNKQ